MTQERELQSVATLVMGTSPKGSTYNHDGVGMPLLNGPTEFGPVNPDCTLFTTAPVRSGESGDLLFCVRGSTTGRMNWADRPYALGRGVAAIRGESPLETRFIRYCIEARLSSLLKRAGGGTFPNLRNADLATFPIPWPDTRHQISAVLSAYDELIDTNLRRIETLEEMAQAVYREWFVNFRFPGHEDTGLVDSPLGPIPETWGAGTFGDLAENQRVNVTPLRSPDEQFDHFSFAAFDEGRLPSTELGETMKSGKLLVDRDSVLLARLNPRIPRVWFARPSGVLRSVASGEFLVLVPCPGSSLELVYAVCCDPSFQSRIATMSGGTSTSHQRLKLDDLMGLPVPIATEEVVEAFVDITRPMYRLVSNLTKQIENLRSTRDVLLPKLVSGHIDVSEMQIDPEWLAS